MPESEAGALRKPLFLVACVVAGLIVMAEIGLSFAIGGGSAGPVAEIGGTLTDIPQGMLTGVSGDAPSGSGIRYLALLDGLLLFTVLLLGSSVLVSQRAYGRVQGIISLVVAFLWILMSLLMAILSFARLLLMVGLFVSAPFGTIAYLAIWGFFPTGDAAVVLAMLLLFKLVFAGFLVASQPRFLKVKGLVTLVALSFVLQLVLGLIQGFLPGVVVSIGDELWALVTAIVALVWAVVMLITAIPGVVNAVRVTVSARE
jgi:hypothetical protein